MTSIQHVPPYSAPRRDTARFSYAPPANHWLRMIYAALLRIRCLLTCVDGVESEAVDIDDPVDVVALPANPLSRKVSVFNGSDGPPAFIYEGSALVAMVGAGETRTLPLDGLLAIRVVTEESAGAGGLVVTRYLRCACGDVPEEYDSDPVGGWLL